MQTNGSDGLDLAHPVPAMPPAKTAEEARRRAALVTNHSIVLAQVVQLLLRSPNYRHYAISDLEWLVMPPLLSGQIALAEARPDPNGPPMAMAAALWASVSEEVDLRLAANPAAPIRLRPDEWRSGEILWLVDTLGDTNAGPQLVKHVLETTLAGRALKVRVPDASGRPVVRAIRAETATKPIVPAATTDAVGNA